MRGSTSGGCRRIIVGPYAENDALSRRSPLFEGSNPVLDQEGTRDAYRLEVDLMPVVMEMRARGIRIDQDAAEQARHPVARQTRRCPRRVIKIELGTAVQYDRDTIASANGVKADIFDSLWYRLSKNRER